MQIPSNMIASKIKWPGIYINIAMAVWGAISACTAAVNNFSGLVAARFFLGVVEAAFLPGVVYYISLFYNRQQMTLRTAIFYSGSQIGNAVGPLIAIGVLNLDGKQGLSGWRWLFIIEGVVTIFFAIIFALVLPHSLQTIRGFTQLESEFLRYNYAKDIGQQDHMDEASAWKGLKLAVSDLKTWLLLATLWAVRISLTSRIIFTNVLRHMCRLLWSTGSHLLLLRWDTRATLHTALLRLLIFFLVSSSVSSVSTLTRYVILPRLNKEC
jgi:MFS family permease